MQASSVDRLFFSFLSMLIEHRRPSSLFEAGPVQPARHRAGTRNVVVVVVVVVVVL